MIRLLLGIVAASHIFMGIASHSYAQTSEYIVEDLYYYDETDKVRQLGPTNKVLVVFISPAAIVKRRAVSPATTEKMIAFLAEYPATYGGLIMHGGNHAAILEFTRASESETLSFIDDISRTGEAKAYPIVLLENREAIADGVVVETKIPLTGQQLEGFLTQRGYGEFSIRQIVQAGRAWHIYFSEIKSPLNIYVLANLLHKDEIWIEKAYPHFSFLEDPLVATILVSPLTGTLGELRHLTLALRLFSPDITIDEAILPMFGEGDFIPKYRKITPPRNVLFDIVEGPIRTEGLDARGRTITYEWSFHLYSVHDWEIGSQTILYERDGVPYESKTVPYFFSVNTLIGNMSLEIPHPRTLFLPLQEQMVPPEIALPAYWFDRYFAQSSKQVSVYGIALGSSVVLVILLLAGLLEYSRRRQAREQSLEEGKWQKDVISLLRNMKESDDTAESYNMARQALVLMLTSVFPKLSSHPTASEVNEALDEGHFDPGMWACLLRVFEELDKRFAKEPALSSESVRYLASDLKTLFEYFTGEEFQVDTVRRQS